MCVWWYTAYTAYTYVHIQRTYTVGKGRAKGEGRIAWGGFANEGILKLAPVYGARSQEPGAKSQEQHTVLNDKKEKQQRG